MVILKVRPAPQAAVDDMGKSFTMRDLNEISSIDLELTEACKTPPNPYSKSSLITLFFIGEPLSNLYHIYFTGTL